MIPVFIESLVNLRQDVLVVDLIFKLCDAILDALHKCVLRIVCVLQGRECLVKVVLENMHICLLSKTCLVVGLLILQTVLKDLYSLLKLLYVCLISDSLNSELCHLCLCLVHFPFKFVVKLVDKLTNENFECETVELLRGRLIS